MDATARTAPSAAADDPVARLGRAPAPSMDGPVSLRALFKRIREASGVTVTGLWEGKHQGSRLDPEAMVHIEVPVGNCADLLDAALDQAAGDGDPMTWQATRFGVEAGPYTALWRESALVVRIYDVSDLMLRVPSFRSSGIPQTGGGSAGGGSSGQGGAAGGSGASGSGGQGSGTAEDPSVRGTQEARRDQVAGIIQRVVVPAAWDVNGGPCSIRPHDGTLIVRAPEFVHRRIAPPSVERRPAGPPPERIGPAKSAP